MIKIFRDKETEKIFNRLLSRKLPQNIQHLARRKLVILDAATELKALRVPPGVYLQDELTKLFMTKVQILNCP